MKCPPNIIFDLGEVLVDIDFQKSVNALRKLAGNGPFPLFDFHQQDDFFDQFETGKMLPAEFIQGLKKWMPDTVSEAQITAAWNAMLLDIPLKKIEILQSLRRNYHVYALSNTNALHAAWLDAFFNKPFAHFFDRAFYSFEIGHRKPDHSAFEYVLEATQQPASHCLMVDDKEENLQSAAALGMQVLHLKNREDFYDYFNSEGVFLSH